MAVTMNIVVFWNVMPCSLVAGTGVSEDLTAPFYTLSSFDTLLTSH